ncbi:SdpI family protein [Microbacterium sp. M1A1_1b]|uniref:SdpI family protein n=1 Tax=Curtobacterium sp. VKM Ac-2922 TaxID=2929475 RepID=UPI001FB44EE8|nr:SdpI family protein [Curtobacterium sp. VKM Ac-2922]MCJ1712954.1 SdpI family protein [Curtobacterium sp. VKM Ac-2922]
MVVIVMIAAILTVIFVVLPARGVIGRNPFVGVRTRATMQDDAAWRRGHQAAILPTGVATGAVIVLGGGSIAVGRENDSVAVILCAAVLVAGALWSVVAAHRAVG